MKSDLTFLNNYLEKENIIIDFNEFIFQAETHPDYPSLYAISDTLSFFKIENLTARVSKQSLNDLPERFITLLKPEDAAPYLSFVERQNDIYYYTNSNHRISISKERFIDVWQDVILVVEKTEDIIRTKKKSNQLWLVALAMGMLITSGVVWNIDNALSTAIILLMSSTGIYFSYEALKQVFGITSSFASAVCGAGIAVRSGCDTVINSKKMKLFSGIEFSDLSIVFFFGHLVSFYLLSVSGAFQDFLDCSLGMLTLGTPLILYSVYFQWRVEKKWCTICLFIICIYSMQLLIYAIFGSFESGFSKVTTLYIFLFGFILSALVWFLLKPNIQTYFDLKSSELKSVRFKRNYSLFLLALKDSRYISYNVLESPIYLGNLDATLRVSLVTNLFCSHCEEMHKQLEDILKIYGNDIRVNIRFNLRLKKVSDSSDLMHFRLLEVYFKNGQVAFIEALGWWFRNKNIEKWTSKFGSGVREENSEKIFELQYEQNAASELLFTPALIIGENIYPKHYDRSDLIYFISELSDDLELATYQSHSIEVNEISAL